MEMLGDHFWPAMYPGIIVGLLVGLSGGNFVSTVLGAVGGLLGAMALYFGFAWLGLEESFVGLVALIAGAAAGALLLMRGAKRILERG
jgi:hypothetical protein